MLWKEIKDRLNKMSNEELSKKANLILLENGRIISIVEFVPGVGIEGTKHDKSNYYLVSEM